MIAKSISYEDFDGNEITEKLYFNLSLPELMRLKFDGVPEGVNLGEYLEKAVQDESQRMVFFSVIEQLIVRSYGVKSEDGKRFNKSPELTEDFHNSAAFEALFTDFLVHPDQLPSFVEGIIPKGALDKLKEAEGGAGAKVLPPIQ